ncbi:Aquaporin-3, partial [Ophiophagus hannah]
MCFMAREPWIKLPIYALAQTIGAFLGAGIFIGTAALIVCVLAIVDPYNNPVPTGLEAFTVGFVILVIGTSMGFNSGYAVNPARDFGPRVLVYQLMIGCHVESPPESSDEESVKLSNVKQRDN